MGHDTVSAADRNSEQQHHPPLMTHRTAAIIGGIGRTLIGLGLIVLSFAAFQLWGTGIQEARAQQSLQSDFEDRQAELEALLASTSTEATTTTQPADQATTQVPTTAPPPSVAPAIAQLLLPKEGEVLGRIEIPAIDMERNIIQGTDRGHLQQGPGHYTGTPLPGQAGNAAIAGHRTTYGQPFHDLDLLVPGDVIVVETFQGTFRYEVQAHIDEAGDEVGHFIVDPKAVEVLNDFDDNRLTLTACHPKLSARQRIIVTAVLASEPAPFIPPPEASETDEDPGELATEDVTDTAANELDDSLGWNMEERTPTLLWASVTLLVFLVAWALARRFDTKWAYVGAAPFFLAALFTCFVHLDHMLPAL